MTDTMDRRDFLRGTAALAGTAAAGTGLSGLFARAATATRGDPAERGNGRRTGRDKAGGYGELRPARPEAAGEGLSTQVAYLTLPPDFRYVVFGRDGSPMSDGTLTPPAHDGMSSFFLAGALRLVRNHEVRRGAVPGGAIATPAYDHTAGGGTTTLEIAVEDGLPTLKRDFVSIAGTHVNCAGGPTPWGSWLTCEETVDGLRDGYQQPHGYVFEVPASADGPVDPVPLKAMGRFVHEAVAVDPATGDVYETEDRGSAGFYRFTPNCRGRLADGGRLEMLAVRGQPNYDTREGQQMGRRLPATWVPIPVPGDSAGTNANAVYEQGFAGGGATFARLEGCWWGNGAAYINSTSGGDAGYGQVWEYRPGGRSGTLTLIAESPGPLVLDSPDNITVSDRTGGVLICEDGDGVQYLRGVQLDGGVFDFATNNTPASNEFAGATFATLKGLGQVLFVNIQSDPGATFAIWGPWERGLL